MQELSPSLQNVTPFISGMPTVWLFIGSALTISFGLASRGRSALIAVLLMYFLKEFKV